ncbi:MAG: response regulator [Chloroflexi bacterium]|nr:response regulator [Chloroflexota bacterium]
MVEDDQAITRFVSLALEQEGYQVQTAANGAEAIAQVEQELPDVILLDMLMPVMDGWEFARRFRERWNRKVPIVVMTAATNAQERAEQIQAEGFLGKPFDLDDLLAVVERRTRGRNSTLSP